MDRSRRTVEGAPVLPASGKAEFTVQIPPFCPFKEQCSVGGAKCAILREGAKNMKEVEWPLSVCYIISLLENYYHFENVQ